MSLKVLIFPFVLLIYKSLYSTSIAEKVLSYKFDFFIYAEKRSLHFWYRVYRMRIPMWERWEICLFYLWCPFCNIYIYCFPWNVIRWLINQQKIIHNGKDRIYILLKNDYLVIENSIMSHLFQSDDWILYVVTLPFSRKVHLSIFILSNKEHSLICDSVQHMHWVMLATTVHSFTLVWR